MTKVPMITINREAAVLVVATVLAKDDEHVGHVAGDNKDERARRLIPLARRIVDALDSFAIDKGLRHASEINIRWESAPHHDARSVQIADVEGDRLMVKRAQRGARVFYGFINNQPITEATGGDMSAVQARVEEAYREQRVAGKVLGPDGGYRREAVQS